MQQIPGLVSRVRGGFLGQPLDGSSSGAGNIKFLPKNVSADSQVYKEGVIHWRRIYTLSIKDDKGMVA
jgi:hypothetical protein